MFAHAHRDSIRAVQVCVGAAFDFHAGTKRMAPPWMQKRGLEWLFRLTQEPGRLWKRYLVQNTLFCCLFARYAARHLLASMGSRMTERGVLSRLGRHAHAAGWETVPDAARQQLSSTRIA